MGGRKTLLYGLSIMSLMSNVSMADTSSQVIKNNKVSVEVIPIPYEQKDNYKYNKYEYWISGSDIVNNFSIKEASDFYTQLIDIIQKNFLYDVKYDKILNLILDGISHLAGKLEITIANSRVLIHDKNLKLVANFNTPLEGDSRAWANLIVNIILSLREKNPDVMKAHPEQIYYLTTLYLIKSLDENATYTDYISLLKKQKGYNSATLGFTYRKIPQGLQVLSIIQDSPIYYSNIIEGDVITHINTTPVKSLKDEQIEASFTNNDIEIIHLDYISYINGRAGETYIKRNKPKLSSIFIDNKNKEIPVISIMNFKENSSYEFKDAIDSLNQDEIKGVILDLRANNGGNLKEALEMANLVISGGDMFKTTGLGADKNQIYTAKSGDILNDLPIVVIADNTTKAEAELFAFILESRGRAVIIGSPTFGKGTISDTYTLPNKAEIKIATKKALTLNDYALDKVGVIPIVCISSFTSDKDVDTFIMNVENGDFKDNRQKYKTITDEEVDKVRKSCPSLYPLKNAQTFAVNLAKKIIINPSVYEELRKLNY